MLRERVLKWKWCLHPFIPYSCLLQKTSFQRIPMNNWVQWGKGRLWPKKIIKPGRKMHTTGIPAVVSRGAYRFGFQTWGNLLQRGWWYVQLQESKHSWAKGSPGDEEKPIFPWDGVLPLLPHKLSTHCGLGDNPQKNLPTVKTSTFRERFSVTSLSPGWPTRSHWRPKRGYTSYPVWLKEKIYNLQSCSFFIVVCFVFVFFQTKPP